MHRVLVMVILIVPFLVSGCHGTSTTTVAVDPSGDRLYVTGGSDPASVRVVDLRTRKTVDRIPLAANGSMIAVNPTNGQVYVAGEGSISLLDMTSSRVVSTIPIGAKVSGMAVDAPGAQLFVLLKGPDRLLFVDTGTFRVIRTMELGLPSEVEAALTVATPAGVVYLFEITEESGGGSYQTTLSLRDLRTLSVITSRQLGDLFPADLALHPSGMRLYIVGWTGKGESFIGRFLVLETSSHRVVSNLQIKGLPVGAAVSPSGAHVYVADYSADAVTVIDSVTNAVVSTINVGKEPLDVEVNPVSGELYVPLDDGTIIVVDASGSRVVTSMRL